VENKRLTDMGAVMVVLGGICSRASQEHSGKADQVLSYLSAIPHPKELGEACWAIINACTIGRTPQGWVPTVLQDFFIKMLKILEGAEPMSRLNAVTAIQRNFLLDVENGRILMRHLQQAQAGYEHAKKLHALALLIEKVESGERPGCYEKALEQGWKWDRKEHEEKNRGAQFVFKFWTSLRSYTCTIYDPIAAKTLGLWIGHKKNDNKEARAKAQAAAAHTKKKKVHDRFPLH